MARTITRVENRDSYWHVVTYEVSEGAICELDVLRTAWPASDASAIIAFDTGVGVSRRGGDGTRESSDFILADEGPVMYGSTLRRFDGDNAGLSKLKYPIDVAHPTDDGKPGPGQAKLGAADKQHGNTKFHHRYFEILWPPGTPDCANTAKQFVKSTVKATGQDPAHGTSTFTQEYPAGDPSANPPVPGGVDAPNWADDKNPAGKNAADQMTGRDNVDNGYLDGPGIPYASLPASYDAKFRIEVRDCNNVLKEWIEFEVHMAIDAQGKLTRDTISAQVHGFGP